MKVIEQAERNGLSKFWLHQKQKGAFMFAVDHRKLNSVIKRDSCPIPRIDGFIDSLEATVIFSTFHTLFAGIVKWRYETMIATILP